MKAIKTLVTLLVVALIALIAFEVGSPLLTARDVNNAATDVAKAGAAKLFAERDCTVKSADVKSADAKAAANAKAVSDSVTLAAFTIDVNQVVHVTVEKEARSLVIKHIKGLRKRDELKKTATAAPTGLPDPKAKPCP
jgi:Flp pilus assembly protein TadG